MTMTTRLILVTGGLVLYSAVHSLLLTAFVRRRAERVIPPSAYRLVYNVVALVLLASLWFATDTRYPILWNLQGWPAILLRLVQAGAAILFLAALWPIEFLHFLGIRQLRGSAVERSESLITRGAYGLCRHPLYLATCVFFSASPRMDLRWLIVALWLWLYSFIGSFFEERRLEAQFGSAYRAYRERCPRLLPFRLGRSRRA